MSLQSRKIAIVTGANHGIGFETSLLFGLELDRPLRAKERKIKSVTVLQTLSEGLTGQRSH